MTIELFHQSVKYSVDLSKGVDISIPLSNKKSGPKCFYAPDFRIEPVIAGDFIGATENGSPVNFKNLFINPHGNGTHTECAGHITSLPLTIHQCLKKFHFIARLISISPQSLENGDLIITEGLIKEQLGQTTGYDTLIVRTLPNQESKLTRDYSGTNPTYFTTSAIQYINSIGIKHLITDLPSIDREEDGGALAGHKAFWDYPAFSDTSKTITEMVFAPDSIQDGLYFCNIQIASIESDASPSKVVLYKLEKGN
jgi:arylformamidase